MNEEEITGIFYEKELQKTSQEKSRIEKVLKRKADKLYVKWKGYENHFNSWIGKKIPLMKSYKWNFLHEIFKCNLLNKVF